MMMEEDRLGMQVTGDCAEITKDEAGMVGISIGGGAPYCPCLYVVQVFDGSPIAQDGRIQAGDEIISVNGKSVKGESKTDVASMIQKSESPIRIGFNTLEADPAQGKSLDLILKKVKHRLVEGMSADAADALGLSRAILCNDLLLKKLNQLEQNSALYKGLVDHTRKLLNAHYNLAKAKKTFGDLFCEIGARESQSNASEAFTQFGEVHRNLEKHSMAMIRNIHPMIADLSTYVNKAIPDTKLTLSKYLDVKFEYLSYCLKLKEMDDEEMQFIAVQEPLYRVETGNYEYRLVLRCRQESRARFVSLRQDVMIKLELLDQKHVQDIALHLGKFVHKMSAFHREMKASIDGSERLFPIDVDLSEVAVKYNTTGQLSSDSGLELNERTTTGGEEDEIGGRENEELASAADLLQLDDVVPLPAYDPSDILLQFESTRESR